MKIFWFDTETGGLIPGKNPILTLGLIIEIDGEVKERAYFKMRPLPEQVVEDGALKVNGITRDEILSFEQPKVVLNQIETILKKYVNPDDRFDQFTPAGHNTQFDIKHLDAFFVTQRAKLGWRYFDYHFLDTMALAIMLKKERWINVPNVKLDTMAAAFGIPLKAHNAMNDIEATRALYYAIKNKLSFKA